jgi:preprotein translocase SecE subunit
MSKDDKTWLNICYAGFFIVVAYFVHKAVFTLGVQLGWTEKYDEWYSLVNNVTCVVLSGGITFWLQRSSVRHEYYLSAIGEIRKVTWPSIPDTKKMTIIVAVVVGIFSVILSAFDVAWSRILQLFLP